ncbi:MAG: hypothetical protein IT305_19990 [Chloroflexi bacterium]|nr:hypothetical protein [Chloroflexota bacterium]
MRGHNAGQDDAGKNKLTVPVGGTGTPITGSPLGTGEVDPFMADEIGLHIGSAGGGQSDDRPSSHQASGREHEAREHGQHEHARHKKGHHGKLTGSNPDAPGYGHPIGGTDR